MELKALFKLSPAAAIKYFKGNAKKKSDISYFEFEIEIKSKYYSYGFESILNSSSITSEWLMEITPDNGQKEIFTRDILKGTYSLNKYFKDKNNINNLSVFASAVKTDDSVLFLKTMNQNKSDLYKENEELSILKLVYDWFKNQLDVNFPERPISDYSYFMTDEDIPNIIRIISAFGTGITNYQIVDVLPEKLAETFPKNLMQDLSKMLEKENSKNKKKRSKTSKRIMLRLNKDTYIFEMDIDDKISYKTIEFNHGNNSISFSMSEESDGTIRILDLIEVLLCKKDKVFFIDEIDRCLHPKLTYKLIKTYLEFSQKKNIQLVVTTHESRLLDFELLRRDEVWFVDKNKDGESEIYSLEEYNSRFDQKIDKAYLEGRYGGVPVFSTIFPVKED